MIRDELRVLVTQAAVSIPFEAVEPFLHAHAIECAHIVADDGGDRQLLGRSKLGGTPDLPEGVPWPTGVAPDGPATPAHFIAQFDLSEIPVAVRPFPSFGMLWLFSAGWDGGPVGIRSVYSPAPGRLHRPVPTDSALAADPVPIRFQKSVSFPFHRREFRDELARRTPGLLAALRQELISPGLGQLGGYAFWQDEDLYRWIAMEKLGRPDCVAASKWTSLSELERELQNVRAARSGSGLSRVLLRVGELMDAELEKKRPMVHWIEQHWPAITAEAQAWKLLCSIQARYTGLSPDSHRFLFAFARVPSRSSSPFDEVTGEIPHA